MITASQTKLVQPMNELAVPECDGLSKESSLPELTLIGQKENEKAPAEDTCCDKRVTKRYYSLRKYKLSAQKDQVDTGIKRNHHYMTNRIDSYKRAFNNDSSASGVTSPDRVEENNNTMQHNSTVATLSQIDGKTINKNLKRPPVPTPRKSIVSSYSLNGETPSKSRKLHQKYTNW